MRTFVNVVLYFVIRFLPHVMYQEFMKGRKLRKACFEFDKNPTEENKNIVIALLDEIPVIPTESIRAKFFAFKQETIEKMDNAIRASYQREEFNNMFKVLTTRVKEKELAAEFADQ